jgi:hypothetical protein
MSPACILFMALFAGATLADAPSVCTVKKNSQENDKYQGRSKL